jgi:cell division protein FtsI/penicillin-binding protein 2
VDRNGGHVYHDWKPGGFERLTTTETIAISSNICAIKIAERLGSGGLIAMLKKFGFGAEGSAKSFPEARSGSLPPEEEQASSLIVPYVSYGQGFRVTPLEMVQAYGAIANGGTLLAPLSADAAPTEKKVVRRVLTPAHAEAVKNILRQVVLMGTGKEHAQSALYSTAGKTATSYEPDLSQLDWVGGNRKSNLAGFIGFAPAKNPQVEVYVAIRDPYSNDGAHGARHAAPVFKQIVEDVCRDQQIV